MADTDTPIMIPESAVPRQFLTGLQYLITGVCAFLLGRGWIKSDTVVLIALFAPVIAVPIYGIYRTWVNNEEKKTIVNSDKTRVPASVARVVS